MLSLVAVCGLLVAVYVRPHEFVAAFEQLPMIPVLAAVGAVGFAIDRRCRLSPNPFGRWAAAFSICIATSLLLRHSAGDAFAGVAAFAPSVVVFFLVSGCFRSFSRLQIAAAVIGGCCLLLCAVALHQSVAPKQCVAQRWSETRYVNTIEDRGCDQRIDCYGPDAERDSVYRCERVGLFGTTTISGRVAYRGTIADPNELALFVSVGLPLIFVLCGDRRRGIWRLVPAVVTGLFGACVLLSQSRTGALAFGAVLAVYAVGKHGARALLWASPILGALALFGGRSGAGAESSVYERFDAWSAAIAMLREQPLLGTGFDTFSAHNGLTAHNSYLLAAAELGLPGFVAWITLLCVSFAAIVVGLRAARHPEFSARLARRARSWGMALLASFVGIAVGMAFLSLTYHLIVWIYLGLVGAYFAAVRACVPGVRLDSGVRALAVGAGCAFTLLAACWLFLRIKGY